jgi:hypothetical protein
MPQIVVPCCLFTYSWAPSPPASGLSVGERLLQAPLDPDDGPATE